MTNTPTRKKLRIFIKAEKMSRTLTETICEAHRQYKLYNKLDSIQEIPHISNVT